MDHIVNLSDLQNVVGKYTDQYQLLVAGGPLAATGAVKLFVGKNKALNMAVGGSAAWFAVKELSGPALKLIGDQFGYLQEIFSRFH